MDKLQILRDKTWFAWYYWHIKAKYSREIIHLYLKISHLLTNSAVKKLKYWKEEKCNHNEGERISLNKVDGRDESNDLHKSKQSMISVKYQ